MFGIAGTVELGTICHGTGTWNRLQDGISGPGRRRKTDDLLWPACSFWQMAEYGREQNEKGIPIDILAE